MEIENYIRSTYGEHYVGKDDFQIQDLLHSIDIAVPFCQANAMKYLARYGKKKGFNRLDLLKSLTVYIQFTTYTQGREHTVL